MLPSPTNLPSPLLLMAQRSACCCEDHIQSQETLLMEGGNRALMKIAWRKHFRCLMCSIRNGKEKRLSLTEEVMDVWRSAWGATEYQNKCKKFSNNRKSETGGQSIGPSRHCGESIYQYRHQQQIRERLGRDPLPHELFEATHKKEG
ncbi:uncharacterized protein LOC110628907 [Manihot esculenta]|uniref:uncharacterized protein LOC110628907 n=1 Tax=Manihot esculenta TaxID=3983 RepID=UPI000B5D2CA9|nr:uncharacterized protein LOC110628907 [Manihot esculenta]